MRAFHQRVLFLFAASPSVPYQSPHAGPLAGPALPAPRPRRRARACLRPVPYHTQQLKAWMSRE